MFSQDKGKGKSTMPDSTPNPEWGDPSTNAQLPVPARPEEYEHHETSTGPHASSFSDIGYIPIDPEFYVDNAPFDPDTVYDPNKPGLTWWNRDKLDLLDEEIKEKSNSGTLSVEVKLWNFKEMHDDDSDPPRYWTITTSSMPSKWSDYEKTKTEAALRWAKIHRAQRNLDRVFLQMNTLPRSRIKKIVALHVFREDPTIYEAHCGIVGYIAWSITKTHNRLVGASDPIQIIHQSPPMISPYPGGPGHTYEKKLTNKLVAMHNTEFEYDVEYVHMPQGYLQIDNDTIIVYFDDHDPVRQILGDFLTCEGIEPMDLISFNINEPWEKDEDGRILGNDPCSKHLSRFLFGNANKYTMFDWIVRSKREGEPLMDYSGKRQSVMSTTMIYLKNSC